MDLEERGWLLSRLKAIEDGLDARAKESEERESTRHGEYAKGHDSGYAAASIQAAREVRHLRNQVRDSS